MFILFFTKEVKTIVIRMKVFFEGSDKNELFFNYSYISNLLIYFLKVLSILMRFYFIYFAHEVINYKLY